MKRPDWRKWIKHEKYCKKWLDSYTKKGALRKTKSETKIYFNKAKHNLDFANWLKDKHKTEIPKLFGKERFYDWVINAYYYSVYHAGLSLISDKKYSSKSHNATLCAVIWFYYHKQKMLKKKDIKLVSESINRHDIEVVVQSKNLRERASYDASAVFELSLANKANKNAVYFYNKIRNILDII